MAQILPPCPSAELASAAFASVDFRFF